MKKISDWIYNLMFEILEDEFTKEITLRENGQTVAQIKMKDFPPQNSQILLRDTALGKEKYFLVENVIIEQNGVIVKCDGIVLG